MNKYVSSIASLICFTLCTAWAQAAEPLKFDVTLVNETRENLVLSEASWPFVKFKATDYKIPKHNSGTFRINVWNETRGRITFSYSTGTQTCRYSGGLDQRRANGWLIPHFETYHWIKAESVGDFHADCRSTIKQKADGKGYDFLVGIK